MSIRKKGFEKYGFDKFNSKDGGMKYCEQILREPLVLGDTGTVFAPVGYGLILFKKKPLIENRHRLKVPQLLCIISAIRAFWIVFLASTCQASLSFVRYI